MGRVPDWEASNSDDIVYGTGRQVWWLLFRQRQLIWAAQPTASAIKNQDGASGHGTGRSDRLI